ncbi:YybH family protein [Pedobacter panaciterrae]|jgi:Ketosteroid isomerase homolog|uniref:Nuclear transport factor 2 family protein n=1 Tax=Pedobacter panaciterrae TaxID=363849 RepID=A0ABU8NN63_9SPHI|nr:nuclear transport factor 2 family protein [Pedobacter panaciterrae]NQX53278.1 nuclear transport factor 2 family protein [Pedobacter panaciterrae]
MKNNDQFAAQEAQVLWTINKRLEAIRQKNLELTLSFYSHRIVSFDVVDPLQLSGLDDIRMRLKNWFSTFGEGPIGFEIAEPFLLVREDVAFCYNLNHVFAAKKDGGILDMFWRETTCYQKMNGKWLIVHSHNSVPFDIQTGKASVGLKPTTEG